MSTFSLKDTARKVGAIAATTSVLVLGFTGIQRASADPGSAAAVNGVGSDTIQDIFDGYSGFDAGNSYTPVVANGHILNSWDAIPVGGSATAPGCIITTYGGASFDRPNGSTNGIVAISHAFDTANPTWYAEEAGPSGPRNPAGTSCTKAAVNVGGSINFARSSRGPKNTGTGPQLNYIPIGRDAVSFAYYDGGQNLAGSVDWTKADLASLYTSGTFVKSGITYHACISQKGSGTTSFFEGAIGVTDGTAQAASAASGCSPSGNGIEENGANTFNTYASTLNTTTDAAIFDFSVGSWISQANPATAVDRSNLGRANHVDLGDIDLVAGPAGTKPYSPAPSLCGTCIGPNSTYYGNTTYGRYVNVVIPNSKLVGLRKDPTLVAMFDNTAVLPANNAAVCSSAASTNLNKFGFLDAKVLSTDATNTACGNLTTVGTGNFYDTPIGTPTA